MATSVDLNSRNAKVGRGVAIDTSQLSIESSKDHLEEIYRLLNLNSEIWENFTKDQKDSLGDLFEYNQKLEERNLKQQAANKLKELKSEQAKSKKIQEWASDLSGIIQPEGALGKGISSLFDKVGLVGDPATLAAEAIMDVGGIIVGQLDQLFNSLLSQIDQTIDKFVESQEKNEYALLGTGRDLNKITDTLQGTFGASHLVKQEEVYNNVSELLQAGIVYNVEQRAFLQTISDDMGAIFDGKTGSLPRLINLQRVDISSSRLAMEASLKEMLNANYENSQYIKNSFQSVSDALIEAQSLMTAQSGIQVESVIQKWLGSLESVGMSTNTINSLATALGQLGSGNISALSGSGIGNLLVMGASQAGLSYADLLTQGLTSEATDLLMSGIVKYISQMASDTSNVVKSEYARIFGINVSDIVAAKNLGESVQSGNLNTNIESLLSSYGELVPLQTKFKNVLENFVYTLGTNVADDEFSYLTYKAGRLTGEFLDALSEGSGVLSLLTAPLKGASKFASTVGLLSGGVKTITDLLDSVRNAGTVTGDYGGLVSEFLSLGAATNDLTQKIVTSGSGLGIIAGQTTSEVITLDNIINKTAETAKRTSDMLGSIKGSSNETDLLKSVRTEAMNKEAEIIDVTADTYVSDQDFYQTVSNFIKDDAKPYFDLMTPYIELQKDFIQNEAIPFFNRESYETYTRISELDNTVTIGEIGSDTSTYIQDMLTVTAINTENIFLLLQMYLGANGETGSSAFARTSLTTGLTNRYGESQEFSFGDWFNYQKTEATT